MIPTRLPAQARSSNRAPQVLLSPFLGHKLITFISAEKHQDLDLLAGLIAAGQVTPVIDRTYLLSEVPQAIRYLQEGHARGKVAITV